jgi:ribosomal protein L37AE/L43A
MQKFRRKQPPNIDFDAIHAAADVRTVAETYLEPSREKGRFVCPSCGKGNVTARPKVWGCWSCSAHDAEGIGRDAIGLVALAAGIGRIEAAKRLAGDLGIGPMVATAAPGRPGQRRVVELKPPEPEPHESPSWREWLAGQVERSHERLMDRADDTSRRAWDYLTSERRLTPETIEAARLGVNLAWCESLDAIPRRKDPCYLPPGIVIPWTGPQGIAGANVRQFHVELRDKYIMATGSRRRWLYPALPSCWDEWTGPVVVVEGEFDALLANQELGGLLPVVTAGGASCRPTELHEPHKLTRFARLLIAADDDDAGHQCRDAWLDFSRRAVPVDLPGGKDLSEAHAAGADLRSWIFEVCRCLEIDLRTLPGLVWEKPPGTIRGRLLDDPRDAAESEAEAAAERAALTHEGGHGGRS